MSPITAKKREVVVVVTSQTRRLESIYFISHKQSVSGQMGYWVEDRAWLNLGRICIKYSRCLW